MTAISRFRRLRCGKVQVCKRDRLSAVERPFEAAMTAFSRHCSSISIDIGGNFYYHGSILNGYSRNQFGRTAPNYFPQCPRFIARTSHYYPQSNGKIERWRRSLRECIRPATSLSLEDVTTDPVLRTGIESWNNPENSARFAVARPREERRAHAQSRAGELEPVAETF
jgi:hypothetical protein